MLSNEWASTRMGLHFHSSRTKGAKNLPTLSVTLTNGLVRRDSIDRKMDTSLSDDEHLLVRKDDIAYNMMRMWQGAFGLASEVGLVSPAYVVLRAKETIDPLFASHLFRSPRLIYLFWAYSYGITEDRLRLYFNDFSAIPLKLPSIPEQKRIAEILSTWDRAIETVEALIANAREQKKALMQSLLTGKKRLPGFAGTWAEQTLKDVLQINYGASPSGISEPGGQNPIIGTGGIVGKTNKHLDIGPAIIIGRKGTIDKPQMTKQAFWAIDTTYFCKPRQRNDIYWLYYIIQNLDFRSLNEASGVPSLSRETLYDVKLRVPPAEEQTRIGLLLSAAATQEVNLRGQLDTLRQEKSALMQQLLTGKRRVKALQREAV